MGGERRRDCDLGQGVSVINQSVIDLTRWEGRSGLTSLILSMVEDAAGIDDEVAVEGVVAAVGDVGEGRW